jgi:hypothetical protein
MSELAEVVSVKVLGGYRLRFKFADGSHGEHDFSDLLKQRGPMAEPLKDPAYFARVRLEYGAPTWPNGYDMCADWVHMQLRDAGALKPAPSVK